MMAMTATMAYPCRGLPMNTAMETASRMPSATVMTPPDSLSREPRRLERYAGPGAMPPILTISMRVHPVSKRLPAGRARQRRARMERVSDQAAEREATDADATDVVEAAGHFRVYLGAAAGVGKTYAMLNEGQRRRARGTDVVIGFVESHGRSLTEALIDGLEVIPRKVVDYRGSRLEEMDLDAVLRRHPELALVDELAHTNVPGSGKNAKRWEDVMDILAAGIDVVTTVNIQHLESIADEVEHMTGARVRERVPDWVVRKADQIELIDSSPEQLRRRMVHGNIYPKEKVPQALTHFFRTDNLIALRELALRFLADETDEDLLEHLRRRESAGVWETCERIMVAVTPVPGMDALLRRAARMAVPAQGGTRRRPRRRQRRHPDR